MSRSLSVQIAYQLRISSFDGKRQIKPSVNLLQLISKGCSDKSYLRVRETSSEHGNISLRAQEKDAVSDYFRAAC